VALCGQTQRSLAYPKELTYPCCRQALGGLGELSPHEGPEHECTGSIETDESPGVVGSILKSSDRQGAFHVHDHDPCAGPQQERRSSVRTSAGQHTARVGHQLHRLVRRHFLGLPGNQVGAGNRHGRRNLLGDHGGHRNLVRQPCRSARQEDGHAGLGGGPPWRSTPWHSPFMC
jgi:hypothetical protein